jgi:predicted nucleic acid-binding protein
MNREIISNTGPILALAIIGRLDLFRDLFENVFVPEEVHNEILEGGVKGAGLGSYKKAGWIKVRTLSTVLDPLLRTALDRGEASVIGLARDLKVSQVLIDERKARRIARSIYGLNVFGSARVLVEAKRMGLLENVAQALNEMREAGYWMADSIVEEALRRAGEA